MEVIKVAWNSVDNVWGDIPRDFVGKVEWSDGDVCYMIEGHKWHKEDGPAYIGTNGHIEYHLNGNEYSKEEHFKITVIMKTTLGKLLYKDYKKENEDFPF